MIKVQSKIQFFDVLKKKNIIHIGTFNNTFYICIKFINNHYYHFIGRTHAA